MDSFSRRGLGALLIAAAGMQWGCITGQTLDGARLDESPEALVEACRQGDWLRVRYAAVTTREFGKVVSRNERASAIRIAELEARPRVPIDTIEVVQLDHGEMVAGDDCVPVSVHLVRADAAPAAASESSLPLPEGILHRDRTAAWAYPLVPLTLALDVVATPALVVLWGPFLAVTD